MREFSKVYCSLWQSQKFEALPDTDAKLFYLYLLTNEHSNSSGCYDLKRGYAMADLGIDEQSFDRTILCLSKALLIEVEKGFNTILINNWVTFNEPTNAKHAIGIFNHLARCSSHTLKTKRAQEFMPIIKRKKLYNDMKMGQVLIDLSHAYGYPMLTETRDRDQRPDRERDLDHAEFSANGLNGNSTVAEGHGGLPPVKEGASKRLLQTSVMKRMNP